jgi:hypothetical protein
VPSYLVETYLARGVPGKRAARERQARSAAEELTREGTRVRFEGSAYVPETETCFKFEAPASRDTSEATRRARFDPTRVIEAVSSRKE